MDFLLDTIPFGYKFDHLQLDGSRILSFKAAYNPLRAMHIIHLAAQRNLEGIMLQETDMGTRLGFLAKNFNEPLPQFFAQQALITKINKEASKRKPDVRELAQQLRDLFRQHEEG